MLTVAGIPVAVRRKRIKHLHLYVKPPDGSVLVTAPLSMSDETIAGYVRTKTDWLKKHIAKYQSHPRPVQPEYVTGETIFVWGREYRIELRQGGRNSVMLRGDTAVLTARAGAAAANREMVLREWYRGLLKAEIARQLPRWEAATGLRAAGWQTKAMTTRWGTCNVKTGRLWFNVHLAEKPPECLSYVIVHELTHLAERTHNGRFQALMDRHMPGWRGVKAMLR